MYTILFTLSNGDIVSVISPTLKAARRFVRSFRDIWVKAEIVYPN